MKNKIIILTLIFSFSLSKTDNINHSLNTFGIDLYKIILNDEIWVKNIYISKYKHDTSELHNPNRNKKLLLNKSEISKIIKSINEKGASLIPTKLFINDKGLVKIQVAIGKGKKMYDKREIIKKRDIEKQIQREKKREN